MSQHSSKLTAEGTIEGTYSEPPPEYGVESAEVTDDVVRESYVFQEGIEDDHHVAKGVIDVQEETAEGTIEDTYSKSLPEYFDEAEVTGGKLTEGIVTEGEVPEGFEDKHHVAEVVFVVHEVANQGTTAPPADGGKFAEDIVRESDATQGVEDEHHEGVFDVHAEAIEGHRQQANGTVASFMSYTTKEAIAHAEEAIENVQAFRYTLTNYCEMWGGSECLPEGFHDIVLAYTEVIHWATEYLVKLQDFPEKKRGLLDKNSAYKLHLDSLYDPLKYFLGARYVYICQLQDCMRKNDHKICIVRDCMRKNDLNTADLKIQEMVKDLLDYEWKIANKLSIQLLLGTPKSVPEKLDEHYLDLWEKASTNSRLWQLW